MVHNPQAVDSDALTQTRTSLHMVAEHVLAAARYQAVGRIGLQVLPGGFGTPPYGAPPRQVSVLGTSLVVTGDTSSGSYPLTTVGDLAARCGITPGGPEAVYTLVTALKPDQPLQVDPIAAQELHAWLATADAALRRFVALHSDESPDPVVLWPEHFDVATTVAECNYGGSPGDEYSTEPYLYVGPTEQRRRSGDAFWNAPFGAVRTWREIPDVEAAVAFLEQGREVFAASA